MPPVETEQAPSRPAIVRAYDWLFSEEHLKSLERTVVIASILGFLLNLGLVFLARTLEHPSPFVASAGKSYLAAISTPFNFILFFEVLTLIAAVPESTSQSIAKQFQIVSLIFVRNFFKDIAELSPENLKLPIVELAPALIELSAGLLMFLLVSAFQHASSKTVRHAGNEVLEEVPKFIERKKLLSLILTVIFLSLAFFSIADYGIGVYRQSFMHEAVTLSPPLTFYSEVFTVMIFTDVLILILSLLVSDHYETVFRNAAFVISTILIRFSLTAPHPYGAGLGVTGMLFGIFTVLVYNYNSRVNAGIVLRH